MPKLTDTEKQEIVRFLDAGKPLPDHYRFLLFDDKREVELVWNGKTADVSTVVLPFQTIEQVDEPRIETVSRPVSRDAQRSADGAEARDVTERAEARAPLRVAANRGGGDADQFMLFDSRGRQAKGWTNKLIWGDNKLILSSLKNGPLRAQIEAQGGLKLIYIDPPFDVGADFSMDIEVGDGGDTLHKRPGILEEIAYRDTWGKGADSFISMIYERLILMRDLLAEDGSIYVHCDARLNSAMRLVMDEIFGESNYRNEIARIKCNPKNYTTSSFGNIFDSIFFYSKSESTLLNRTHEKRDEKASVDDFPLVEGNTNRRYKTVPLHAKGFRRGATGEKWKGVPPPSGRHWAYVPNTLDDFNSKGLIEWSSTGNPRLKQYADEDQGKTIQDIWEFKDPGDRLALYATQKPDGLLERIISASSNPGDLVADFFCGSGTTAAVAEKLGRKWIATDLGKFAVHTTRKRMIGVQRQLKAAGQDYRAFELLNLGRYERQHYVGVNPNLREAEQRAQLDAKEAAFLDLILRAYRAEPVTGYPAFHGKKAGRLVAVGPVNLPVTRLFVEEIIVECRKKHVTKVDILGFEFEMGLFPNVLEEARGKGIDIQPKQIPPEVFDKRAVDRGQVAFYDVAAIEVTPIVEGNAVAVRLTDFSVFYSQDSIAAAEKELADKTKGGSRIVVERGQIVKVSKSAKGITTREILTEQWTDWVDYWAVDFDYESKREIIRVASDPDPVSAYSNQWEERWTGEYVFENEWQSFRTKRDRSLELTSAAKEVDPGRRKIAVKVVDIFGNDTMTIVDVSIGAPHPVSRDAKRSARTARSPKP